MLWVRASVCVALLASCHDSPSTVPPGDPPPTTGPSVEPPAVFHPACDALTGPVAATCADAITAIVTGNVDVLLRHVGAADEIGVLTCADGPCKSWTYVGYDEARIAFEAAGGLANALGTDDPTVLRVHGCAECANDQLLTICGPDVGKTRQCLGAEGPLLRNLATAVAVPDPDPDRDVLGPASDKCPDKAEDYDGKDDTDGCPDADVPLAGLSRSDRRYWLGEPLPFAGSEPGFSRRSEAMDQLAHLLRAHRELTIEIEVRIEPDPRACMAKPLSGHRAETLRKYLVEKGVEPERVKTRGNSKTPCSERPVTTFSQDVRLHAVRRRRPPRSAP